MKLGMIYRHAIEAGIAKDPRGTAVIRELLKQEKKRYDKLDEKEKAFYDADRLFNPYADTRILYGDEAGAIKTVMVGIDIGSGEMVLADRLRQKGKAIDCVIAHHPEGQALANFYEVMALQADVFMRRGVAIAVAESLTSERMGEVSRSVSSANHMQTVDTASLLDVPLMCLHTPADNHVTNFLQKLFDTQKPATLKRVLDLLNDIPEYNLARKYNAGPFLLQGAQDSRAGNILVDMTGGTEGSKDIFARLAQQGVSTLVCMHLSESHFKKAKEERINVVNAGHIASDNLGLNLLLDTVMKKGALTVIEASGFRRVKRTA